MYYCNDLKSLSVLSLYEGELLGVVDKLYFDKKMKKLIALELIGENDSKLILPTKNIYHIGKNAITVKNNQAVEIKVDDCSYSVCPINSKAYSINGEFLGIIKEMSFNDKFITDKISLDNNNLIEISRLASCGKNTVIFYDTISKNVNVKKFTPNKQQPNAFKTTTIQATTILPIEQSNNSIVPVENTEKQPIQTADFLLGRICTKDIYNFNNELLIKAHGIINKKNLKEINKYGKLRELMLYTK